jgi:hypothetical protein
MSSRRRPSRQVSTLQRETALLGQPRGERLCLQAGDDPEKLVAALKDSTQVMIDINETCSVCLEAYETDNEIWRVQACGHIFHYICIQPVDLP